tara:strand:+ start:64 stop:192 length:129 start_codon:yes stop_codon:yes gene_type:complete
MKIATVNAVNKPELFKAYQGKVEELQALLYISLVLIAFFALT